MNIHYIQSTNSTNDHILNINEDMALVYTDLQTVGRGQRGNSWESEEGKNLTFSFMLKPQNTPADRQFTVSKIVALALVNTLKHYDIEAKIKWPNDIYVNDFKISGILIENSLNTKGQLSRVVCGIGLNVNQTKFLSNAPNPISIAMINGNEKDKVEVLEKFCKEFETLYTVQNLDNHELIDNEYWNKLYRKDEVFEYCDKEGKFKGKIIGIASYGELIIQKEDTSIHKYMFKEVSYIL